MDTLVEGNIIRTVDNNIDNWLNEQKEILLDLIKEETIMKEFFLEQVKKITSDNYGYRSHMAEKSTNNHAINKNLLFASNSSFLIELAYEALDRISNGVYRKCFKCSHEISYKRLEAVPTTKFCINCAETLT